MGSIKSAAAATFLKTYLKINDYSAWINLGIAGFFKGPIGDIYQANKVVLKEKWRCLFPRIKTFQTDTVSNFIYSQQARKWIQGESII